MYYFCVYCFHVVFYLCVRGGLGGGGGYVQGVVDVVECGLFFVSGVGFLWGGRLFV